MEKKLYRVKVVLYVMAENESDACLAATQAPFDIFECTARKAERIDSGWEDAIPYNTEEPLTCAEIMSGKAAPIRPAMPVSKAGSRRRVPVRTPAGVAYARS